MDIHQAGIPRYLVANDGTNASLFLLVSTEIISESEKDILEIEKGLKYEEHIFSAKSRRSSY
jgi:hypothetical protein